MEHPFTEESSGRLMYGADGMMAAFLQAPNWPASSVDFVPQRSRFIAYSGKYAVKVDRLVHHVDAASDPRWIGIDLVRYVSFADDMLIIETRPSSTYGIGRFHHHLRWMREGVG